jgi:MFS family permease
MEAIGPFVAAALLEGIGIRALLLIDVATFVLSAALLTRLRPLPPAAVQDGQRPRIVADVAIGLRFMATAPLIRAVALGFVAVVICNGIDDVALLFLVRDSFHANTIITGYLYGAVGIGLLAGYLILGRRGKRSPMIVLFLLGCAISSLGNLLTGLAWTLAAAFTLQLLRGMGLSATDIGVNTLIQRQVPAEMTGRVFGTLYGAVGAAAAISYLVGAALLETTGPRVTFVVAGSIGLLCTITTAAVISRHPPTPPAAEPPPP